MSEDKGKEFLKLIDEQNKLQWRIVENLKKLIESDWTIKEIKSELESLLQKHQSITIKINS